MVVELPRNAWPNSKPSTESSTRKAKWRQGFVDRWRDRLEGGAPELPHTRQTRRRLLFEASFRELCEKHGPEGRRRLRAMARSLSHRRYRELRAAEVAALRSLCD